ncbi:hypothetical protein FRC01_002434 [Tulasnella sp. 417]|nr:hypothetical protein FRC01_002434 [Tulasnella sp. 417]
MRSLAHAGSSQLCDPSRRLLYLQAVFWRVLMDLGMWQHTLPSPRPLKPRFVKYVDTTLAAIPGRIRLVFYTLKDYGAPGNEGKKYPCIVNFHGGGFTLGTASDDCRWATALCEQADTVVCSVDYRRAPEHPFPTAVKDGTDAVMWVWDHAAELGTDGDRLGLQDALLRRRGAEPSQVSSDAPLVLSHEHRAIKLSIPWYPLTDFTATKEERRKTITRLDKALPQFFNRLFDSSYLHSTEEVKLDSPYLSRGVASGELLRFMPDEILMYTCEWDELRAEAERFTDRVKKLGKKIKYRMVEGVPHGWDRDPNPFKVNPVTLEVYAEAAKEIKRVFYGEQSNGQ